jgi:hypothetical protein
METFVLILLIGAFAAGFHFGASRGRAGVLKAQKRKIDGRFTVGSDDSFRRTYGLAGLYVADVNALLLRTPLVIINAADFMDMVARRHAGADASSAELERMKDKLTDDYLMNNGISPNRLAEMKRVSGYGG